VVERSIADHFADMYLLPICAQAGGEGAVQGSSTEGPSGCEFVRATENCTNLAVGCSGPSGGEFIPLTRIE